MKLILAIIQPSKLDAVKAALNKVEVFRLTVVDVQGFGRQKGQSNLPGARIHREYAAQSAATNCGE